MLVSKYLSLKAIENSNSTGNFNFSFQQKVHKF